MTIDWFGAYTSVEKKIGDDSDISTGQHFRGSDIVPPKINSDQITLTPEMRFGFGFTLNGTPKSNNVVLKQVYKYPSPGMPRGNSGQFAPDDRLSYAYTVGSGNVMGYKAGNVVSHWPTGTWIFQLWSDDKLLVEKSFTVSRP